MGIFAKIKKAWFDTIVWETIDDEFYDELEDSLILADLGATVAHDAVKKLRDVVYQKSIQRGDDVKQALREILIEKLNVGDTALDLSTQPSVVLVIGVNGVGKTTSIGKLAHSLKGEGKRVLLCAADAAFARISRNIFGSLNFGSGFQIVFMVLAVFFVTYGIFAYLAERSLSDEAREKTPAEALPAIIVLIPLTVLYMVFCWIQIFCLFGGNFNMQGMTYAEYARRGFFDLLAVCILNLILVQAGYGFFKKNKVLDITMTVMSACTYIMIASSAFRMIQYVKHYNLTFLRVFVLWFLVVLTVLLTGVIISIFKRSFPLFRFSMVVVTVCYLLLSFAHVDYWIASYNLHRGETAGTASYHMGHTDYSYLRYMSSDAALAFREYIEDGGKEAASADEGVWYGEDGEREYFVPEEDWLTYYTKRMDTRYEKMGIRGFNLSQYIANKVLHGN